MASLRKIPFTKPLPPNAEIFTKKGKRYARWIDGKNRQREAELTADGQRIRGASRKWYGSYTDADGIERCVPLAADKTAAQQMLAALVKKAELGKAGIVDPFEQQRRRPLLEHLTDWEASLRASGATAKHVRQTAAAARRVFAACGFVFPADVSASRVQRVLAALKAERPPLPPLQPGKDSYTKAELADAAGIEPHSVGPLVKRWGLAAVGNGKARRFPRATVEALRSQRQRGRSAKTLNLYLDAVKSFCRWLVQDRRSADNPLAHLSGENVRRDRRHDRRPLTADELHAVLSAAGSSTRTFRTLTGIDRRALYLTAATTGFRAAELASLTPSAFALDGEPATVTLAAANAKNGRDAVQPLPSEAVELLRGYLGARPSAAPVWPGSWVGTAAEMFRIDLEAAGILYRTEAADGRIVYADFHSLRHSYIALLDRCGVTLKEAMALARHSDPKLTMAVYGRAALHDLGAAVERLPSVLSAAAPEPLQATGTDDAFFS